MKSKSQDLLFITLLISGILMLFLNDRIWKYEYGTWLTGKLSDFAGLLTLPIFIALVFPRSKKYISLVIGMLFLIWKSPISNPIIAIWNSFQMVELARVIDPTDFLALTVLPIAHLIIVKYDLNRIRQLVNKSVHKIILLPTLFLITLIFCSTSIMQPAYPKGDILIEESYHIKGKTEAQILEFFKESGMTISVESKNYQKSKLVRRDEYYQIDQFISNNVNGTDTLTNINFRIYEEKNYSSLFIINISIPDDWDLQDWRALKKKKKKFKKIIKEELVKRIDGV